MQKKKGLKKQILIAVPGMVLCVALAVCCYRSVEKTIIANEQDSLKSLAKVNAQSLLASLEAKQKLVYASLSGDMDEEGDIETAILKLGEKGTYIPLDEIESQPEWEQEQCEKAGMDPGMVIVGPVKEAEDGFYILHMTKAISIQGKIAGYVQVELNLGEIYDEEQALSSLQLKNDGYCIVKSADGTVVMPGGYDEEDISFSYAAGNGCTVTWAYEAWGGIPQRARKLIAYETIELSGEQFTLCLIEDYDKVTQPIEQIALYICVFGAAFFIWMLRFIYKIEEQRKKEELLVQELQYEKKINETFKEQEGLMQKYNHSRTLSVITGTIAHEFNNLMTPIVLYVDLLMENEDVYSEMPEEISELKSAAKRCAELSRQLLDYSRQGSSEKVLVDYNATFAINEAVSMVKKLIPEQIVLKTEICRTSYYLHGQMGALNQILLNLATNAVQAMPEGGTLQIRFGVSTDCEEDIRLVVEDTGTGIAPEIRQQIFHPFFTAGKTGEGSGLGLAVVKQLTEEHGGVIHVKTEEGKGTMFILDFPKVS